ncbi:hypothetical protein SEUCBS139899_010837 [Sporothrix eucalyptigena]|uniref:Siderophore iron transporter mirB n=1 Tax=Sporothrix eucalyptigena TaxID=1812306 RepID=A0ABP0D1M2_9PEZI
MPSLDIAQSPAGAAADAEKNVAIDSAHEDDGVLTDEKPSNDAAFKQEGVQQVEAITQVWSKRTVILMFVLIYLMNFVLAFQSNIQGSLSPYVTSSFEAHGLLATVGIVSTIIGGVSSLTIAKIIDVWGRVEGFCFMLLLITVGQVMKAACKNVETYAAAQTLYWVGYLGLLYILNVVMADMTTLKNRLLIFGINQTPTIATVFAGSNIAQLYYDHLNYRWAFGSWAIIILGFSVPILIVFILQAQKAKKFGLYPVKPSDRTFWESTKHYVVAFDVVGLLLSSAGFSLLLLPFSLATSAPNGWKTGYIIAMFIVGGICLILFALWEKWYAPVQYLPWKHLTDRTILGGSLVYGFMFCSIYCWDTYYSSYLQVVNNQSITTSGYILNGFSLGAAFLSPFIGALARYTGNFKYVGAIGLPLMIIATGLLIKFRSPGTGVGMLVFGQLLNGFGSGFLSLCSQMAVMAPVSHQEIAVVLAIYGLFGSIGASVGETIAGALWTNDLPKALYNSLPADSKNLTESIYESLVVQLSYPVGSPIRDAINEAYGTVMHKMVIAGAVFMVPTVLSLFLWRNIDLKKVEEEKGTQSKGNIF